MEARILRVDAAKCQAGRGGERAGVESQASPPDWTKEDARPSAAI